MKIFDSFKAMLQVKKPTLDQMEASVASAEQAVASLRSQMEELEGRRRDLLIASDTERARHKQAISTTADQLADAELYLATLRERLALVQQETAEAERAARYAAALSARADAGKRLAKIYPQLVSQFVDLMEEMARADAAVDAANVDLPKGRTPLARTEAAMLYPRREREVLGERIERLWIADGMSRPLEDQRAVRQTGTDIGLVKLDDPCDNPLWNTRPLVLARLRSFRRIEYLPAEAVTQMPAGIAGNVQLPAMFEGSACWGYYLSGGRIVDPQEVLAEVAAVRRLPRARSVSTEDHIAAVVEFELIDDPAEQSAA
ncbi:hypothetical protein KHC28_15175 [Ancylobacter sonchi]|uniref:hypothetical protein n=1 Tax=Ancylobacter sonchi TaxID=1937790 RepID=UPI001BD5B103|nr:hypothetical protein [Ancylobacter sonchi]MBS7534995.1 hypothetical protein [Ancylobacter sonchi]